MVEGQPGRDSGKEERARCEKEGRRYGKEEGKPGNQYESQKRQSERC